ncbi:MAG: DUF1003 domain-containing protein [bacterium]|nr:DUF1003 domain-containing protein [bacterium]
MPNSLDEYLTTRHEPQNINSKHRGSLKLQDRIAVMITAAVGSMYTVYFLSVFVLGWMLWQAKAQNPIDPFPFVFMIFISNILQLLLLPLIMVGQNIQNRHARMRAEEEYVTTKTIHQDIEKMLITLHDSRK